MFTEVYLIYEATIHNRRDLSKWCIHAMVFAEEMRRLCGILNNIVAEALPGLSGEKQITSSAAEYAHNFQTQENLQKTHHNVVLVRGVPSSTFPVGSALSDVTLSRSAL